MKTNLKKYILAAVLTLLVGAIGFGIGFFLLPPKAPLPNTAESEKNIEYQIFTETKEKREEMPKIPLMKGIDVSKWQGKPDWKKIAESGVEFAMIRIGYHGSDGTLGEDGSADYNLTSADKNGVLTGVYFYSLAKNGQEAEAEALWVLGKVGKYAISLPIVIDYEMMENDIAVTATERTDIALAFLRRVRDAGYEGMLYVPIEEFSDENLWEKERILSEFKVWGADYEISPENGHPDGVTDYAMWQYSNTGQIDGISGNVDLNYAYFSAERILPQEETGI